MFKKVINSKELYARYCTLPNILTIIIVFIVGLVGAFYTNNVMYLMKLYTLNLIYSVMISLYQFVLVKLNNIDDLNDINSWVTIPILMYIIITIVLNLLMPNSYLPLTEFYCFIVSYIIVLIYDGKTRREENEIEVS